METDKQISRREFLGEAAKVAGALAVVVVGAAIAEEAKGDAPQDLVPEYSFVPFVLPPEAQGQAIPSQPQTIIEFPRPKVEPKLSPAEIREAQVKKELKNVQKIMNKNVKVFGKKRIEDVNMYYPIYRAVADKYRIPWYLLFIVHEAETGASAGKRGFAPDSYYKGAMQLDPEWTGSFMDGAAKGLKYLAKVPQRHSDDWKNIATGGRILSRNFRRYKRMGTDKATLNALLLYSAEGPAQKRYETFLQYEKLFPAAKKKKTDTSATTLRRAS